MLPPAIPLPFRGALNAPPSGFEVVELFLGLRRDPRELGFQGENYWIFSTVDHDEMYDRRNELLDGRAMMVYLIPIPEGPEGKRTYGRGHCALLL
jgi:all-trans-retinol 13,14-reductase